MIAKIVGWRKVGGGGLRVYGRVLWDPALAHRRCHDNGTHASKLGSTAPTVARGRGEYHRDETKKGPRLQARKTAATQSMCPHAPREE